MSDPSITALAFDIETLPLARSLDLPYPEEDRSPPSNYGVEAREKWRVKDREAWEQDRIKTYSLSPLYGRVCAIGLAWDDAEGERVERSLLATTEEEEAHLLREFWQMAMFAETLVTWNGLAFDVPFVLTRCAILDVLPTVSGRDLLRRYSTYPHCDVKALLHGWDTRGKGSLDDTLAAFGLPTKIAHGSEVYGMAGRGEWDAIGAYAAADAGSTLKLFERIERVFG